MRKSIKIWSVNKYITITITRMENRDIKLCLRVHKAVHENIAEMHLPVGSVKARRRLRSSTAGNLIVPSTITQFAQRALPAAAVKSCTNLPVNIRSSTSVIAFKKALKTRASMECKCKCKCQSISCAPLRSPALTARKQTCGSLRLPLHKPHVAILTAARFTVAVFCSGHPLAAAHFTYPGGLEPRVEIVCSGDQTRTSCTHE